jgi:hypothetical protein
MMHHNTSSQTASSTKLLNALEIYRTSRSKEPELVGALVLLNCISSTDNLDEKLKTFRQKQQAAQRHDGAFSTFMAFANVVLFSITNVVLIKNLLSGNFAVLIPLPFAAFMLSFAFYLILYPSAGHDSPTITSAKQKIIEISNAVDRDLKINKKNNTFIDPQTQESKPFLSENRLNFTPEAKEAIEHYIASTNPINGDSEAPTVLEEGMSPPPAHEQIHLLNAEINHPFPVAAAQPDSGMDHNP